MKNLTIKALVAVAAMAGWSMALATTVYFVNDGLRDGNGTYYNLFVTSPTTWDWTAGVLTMTSGVLQADQRSGNTPGGSLLMTDYVAAGLVVDTNTGTTTTPYPGFGSYSCIEGTAGASIGMNLCAGTAFGANGINESSVAYNVGGDPACEQRTVGGDDVANAVFRGLRSWNGSGAPCGGTTDGDNTGRGALDMIRVAQDSISTGRLILANWNDAGPINTACLAPGDAAVIDPVGLCRRAHWLTFAFYPEAVPIPAALWLLGSALGVLGVARRRASA